VLLWLPVQWCGCRWWLLLASLGGEAGQLGELAHAGGERWPGEMGPAIRMSRWPPCHRRGRASAAGRRRRPAITPGGRRSWRPRWASCAGPVMLPRPGGGGDAGDCGGRSLPGR